MESNEGTDESRVESNEGRDESVTRPVGSTPPRGDASASLITLITLEVRERDR